MADANLCCSSESGGLNLTGEEAFALLELCLQSPLEVTQISIDALIKLANHYLVLERLQEGALR